MTDRPTRRTPRRRRARALLTVAAGAVLTGTIAASVVGCGDDTTAPVTYSNDFGIRDLSVRVDIGNPIQTPPDMSNSD